MKEVLTKNLIKISKEFSKRGSRLYVVGGYVRNYLLGLPLTDIDICGNLHFVEIKSICENLGFECKEINKKLGTLLIIAGDEKYEYTPFRTENYVLGKHSPESVEWTDDIRVDARRRDFTCNALYYDIEDDNIIDFYNGVGDIEAKCLRAIETPEWVFSSDGLRVLRLIRFACGLGFKIDRHTSSVAKKMLYQLKYISGERKTAELKAIFDSSKKYNIKDTSPDLLNAFKIYPFLINMPNIPHRINLKKYSRPFEKCEDKFLAFVFVLLLEKYGKHKVGLDQIIFDTKTLVNEILHAGGDIKEMSKALYVISRLGKNEPDMEICVVFNDLKVTSKEIVRAFCKTDALEDKIARLKDENIPLGIEDLKISNAEIMEIVPKELITHIKTWFLDKCQKGLLVNDHEILIKSLKDMKKPSDEIEVVQNPKKKRNKTT